VHRSTNLAGSKITIYDEEGNSEDVYIARKNDRVKKDDGSDHPVLGKLTNTRKTDNIRNLAILHIDELLEVSEYNNENQENNHQWLDENGWVFRTVYIQDIKGRIYEANLNIARGKDRNIIYDINNIKKVDDAHGLSDSTKTSAESRSAEHLLNETITENSIKSNTQILNQSRDSSGRVLTDAQQDYFKDSKIRDEDGNLLVVYHGTDAEFTVFDSTKTRSRMDIQGSFLLNDRAKIVHRSTYYAKNNKYNALRFKKVFNDGEYISVNLTSNKKRLLATHNIYMEKSDFEKLHKNRNFMHSANAKKTSSETPETKVPSVSNSSISENDERGNTQTLNQSRDSSGRVLTEAQQEYFKDSKIRDEDGNLLVVYHGTPDGNFTVFDRNQSYYTDKDTGANWFSSNRQMVERNYYTDNRQSANGKQIYEVYLNVTNPLVIEGVGKPWNSIDLPNELQNKGINKYYDFLKKEKVDATTASTDQIAKYAKQNGYDGVIFKGIRDGSSDEVPSDVYAVFNSNQIKNVTNENPTDNPDIRYQSRVSNEDSIKKAAVELGYSPSVFIANYLNMSY